MQTQLSTTENSLFRPALYLESPDPTIDPPDGGGGTGGGGSPAPAPVPPEEEPEEPNP